MPDGSSAFLGAAATVGIATVGLFMQAVHGSYNPGLKLTITLGRIRKPTAADSDWLSVHVRAERLGPGRIRLVDFLADVRCNGSPSDEHSRDLIDQLLAQSSEAWEPRGKHVFVSGDVYDFVAHLAVPSDAVVEVRVHLRAHRIFASLTMPRWAPPQWSSGAIILPIASGATSATNTAPGGGK